MLNGEGSEDIAPMRKSRNFTDDCMGGGGGEHVHADVCKIRRLAELALVLHKSRSNLACLLILCSHVDRFLLTCLCQKLKKTVKLSDY